MTDKIYICEVALEWIPEKEIDHVETRYAIRDSFIENYQEHFHVGKTLKSYRVSIGTKKYEPQWSIEWLS
tara:strand:+ start:446 stop:655 length:210 start_codon:yes stop_codon:yes gene_type:complete